jgi:hypothetical protein
MLFRTAGFGQKESISLVNFGFNHDSCPDMKLPQTLVATVQVGSVAVGWLIIAASIPLAFLGGAAPSDTMPTWSPLVVFPLVACLMASGFLYVGMHGRRLSKSKIHRVVAGLLLLMPLIAGTKLLLTPGYQGLHPFGFFLFVPACLSFLGAVWPFQLTRAEHSTTTA